MTRDEFIKIIANYRDSGKILEKVDEGIRLLGGKELELRYDSTLSYSDSGKIQEVVEKGKKILGGKSQELWYDECACVLQEMTETNETHQEIDFASFCCKLSAKIDSFKALMKFPETIVEVEIRGFDNIYKVLKIALLLAQHSERFCSKEMASEIQSTIISNYCIPNLKNENLIKEISDALTLLDLRDVFGNQSEGLKSLTIVADRKSYYLNSPKAQSYFHDFFVSDFCFRHLSTYDREKLEIDLIIAKKQKKKYSHRVVHELYKVFAKYGHIEFKNKQDLYHIGDKDGFYASLNADVSVVIYDLMHDVFDMDSSNENENESSVNVKNRKEKIDYIRNLMETDTEEFDTELPVDKKGFIW